MLFETIKTPGLAQLSYFLADEAAGEAVQQLDHVVPPLHVQRAEDLVQDQHVQRVPRPLRDHLADREPQHQVGDVLLAAADHRLLLALVEDQDVVRLVDLQRRVAPRRDVGEERAGQLAQLRTDPGVQLDPEPVEGRVQLGVQPPLRLELRQPRPVRFQLPLRPLRGRDRLLRGLQATPCLREPELRRPLRRLGLVRLDRAFAPLPVGRLLMLPTRNNQQFDLIDREIAALSFFIDRYYDVLEYELARSAAALLEAEDHD